MSYSEENGQVVLRISREEAQQEVLRLLREFDDRAMKADFEKWQKSRFRKKRTNGPLNDGHPTYTPYQVPEKKR